MAAGELTPRQNWEALQGAWKPFGVAWKAPWWNCVAVPEDVSDEAGFRSGAPHFCIQQHHVMSDYFSITLRESLICWASVVVRDDGSRCAQDSLYAQVCA